jgi:hypothetical protein
MIYSVGRLTINQSMHTNFSNNCSFLLSMFCISLFLYYFQLDKRKTEALGRNDTIQDSKMKICKAMLNRKTAPSGERKRNLYTIWNLKEIF